MHTPADVQNVFLTVGLRQSFESHCFCILSPSRDTLTSLCLYTQCSLLWNVHPLCLPADVWLTFRSACKGSSHFVLTLSSLATQSCWRSRFVCCSAARIKGREYLRCIFSFHTPVTDPGLQKGLWNVPYSTDPCLHLIFTERKFITQ